MVIVPDESKLKNLIRFVASKLKYENNIFH